MFRIHEPQVAHFARRMRRDFERRMASWLREAYADAFAEMGDDEVASWVSAAIDKALQYGIRTEPEVAALMTMLLVLGLDADETTPWVREVLADRGLLAEGKVRTLGERARAHAVPGIDAVLWDDAPPAAPEGDGTP